MLLIYLSCTWVAGVFLGSKLDLPGLFIPIGLIPLFLVFFTRRRKPIIIAVTGIVLLLLAATYSSASLNIIDESRLRFYNDRGTVELKGRVVEDPDVRDNNARLKLSP